MNHLEPLQRPATRMGAGFKWLKYEQPLQKISLPHLNVRRQLACTLALLVTLNLNNYIVSIPGEPFVNKHVKNCTFELDKYFWKAWDDRSSGQRLCLFVNPVKRSETPAFLERKSITTDNRVSYSRPIVSLKPNTTTRTPKLYRGITIRSGCDWLGFNLLYIFLFPNSEFSTQPPRYSTPAIPRIQKLYKH